MKRYGVSLIQFVLTEQKNAMTNYMSFLSPEEHNEFVTEYSMLEKYMNNIDIVTVTDYSGLDTMGIPKGHFIADRRHYELGKKTKPFNDKSTYLIAKRLVHDKEEYRHKDIDYTSLTPSQCEFINTLNKELMIRYKRNKFMDSYAYKETQLEDFRKILGIHYSKIYAIFKKYSKIPKTNKNMLLQTYHNLKKLISVSDADVDNRSRELKQTQDSISVIIANTSQKENLFKLLILNNLDMSHTELIKALQVLRDAGLSGLDIHDNYFNDNVWDLKTESDSIVMNDSTRLNIGLLSREIHSLLAQKGDVMSNDSRI